MPAEEELKRAFQPLQEKMQAANKTFNDEYAAVCAETDAIRNDPNATEGQKLDARNRWAAAMNKCSAACRPARDQFELEAQPLRDRYNEQVAPFKAIQNAACDKAQRECDAAVAKFDAIIDHILRRAASPWEGILSWLLSWTGR